MSRDGYMAGPDQSEENPLGVGGTALHEWAVELPHFQEMHGRDPSGEDESSPSDAVLRESTQNVGASLMGRNMFGPIRGDWGDESWRGWWGDDPPFRTPVFVLTHHHREPIEMENGTTFTFVTDGIGSALEQARAAAADKDVALGGGGATIQQYLAAGLVDELQVHIAPVILGGGVRLFENLGEPGPTFEPVRTVHTPEVTHIRYSVS